MSYHRAERRRRARTLAAEAAAIRRQLANAVALNLAGPVLGRTKISYELAERVFGTAHGGMGMVSRLVNTVGLAGEIDSALHLLRLHKPYRESDHVLNIVYNALCGGQRLDDIEYRRRDRVFLDGLGVESLLDPTTAGDFCRRFDTEAVMALRDAVNRVRGRVWAAQPASFVAQTARIDADACCRRLCMVTNGQVLAMLIGDGVVGRASVSVSM